MGGPWDSHKVPLPDHLRADQKLKHAVESITQMPPEHLGKCQEPPSNYPNATLAPTTRPGPLSLFLPTLMPFYLKLSLSFPWRCSGWFLLSISSVIMQKRGWHCPVASPLPSMLQGVRLFLLASQHGQYTWPQAPHQGASLQHS